MKVLKTIKPGQNGSRRFLREYGEKLVNVRYRQDLLKQSAYTTIEIIVDQRELLPPNVRAGLPTYYDNLWVAIKITFKETELRSKVKQRGAKWSLRHKVWIMQRRLAVELGIADRVIPNLASRVEDVDLYS